MPSAIQNNAAFYRNDIPSIQTAIVQGDGGRLHVNRSNPTPTLLPDQVLVKVAAVALNPCG